MVKNPLARLSNDAFEAIALRFRALGEVSRLKIVETLQTGEKSVTEIVELTGLGQSNVSRHLTVLVSAGLIGRKKSGTVVQYRIVDKTLSDLCLLVCRSVNEKQ